LIISRQKQLIISQAKQQKIKGAAGAGKTCIKAISKN
jgi:hypothetical protein